MSLAAAAERGWLPDPLTRFGIRSLLRARLALECRRARDAGKRTLDPHRLRMRQGPIAVEPASANDQHYETPLECFRLVLGPRLKLCLLACAELFGYRAGREWFVAHYLLRHDRNRGSGAPSQAAQGA